MPRDLHPHPADVAQHRADAAAIERAALLLSAGLALLEDVDTLAAHDARGAIDDALVDARARVREAADEDGCVHVVVTAPLFTEAQVFDFLQAATKRAIGRVR